ncbi:MAG: type II toxin-antitoxin system Phd/YefM family antitoxin [Chloroflexi bacterium]|nr:type II toxin-antitoxin system Phd/YefM family antitoxin [Chloroflexota bacterium]
MLRTTTGSELRGALACHLERLSDSPAVVLSHGHPAAVLLDPQMFDALMESAELLEDLPDGQRAVAEYLKEPAAADDAEKVFQRLGT